MNLQCISCFIRRITGDNAFMKRFEILFGKMGCEPTTQKRTKKNWKREWILKKSRTEYERQSESGFEPKWLDDETTNCLSACVCQYMHPQQYHNNTVNAIDDCAVHCALCVAAIVAAGTLTTTRGYEIKVVTRVLFFHSSKYNRRIAWRAIEVDTFGCVANVSKKYLPRIFEFVSLDTRKHVWAVGARGHFTKID